ncbi:serine hydrolase domain-containing protein [Streptomyces sp. 796.1]|uniref:serine hydrolase domain-containing protein n=1 Tax=Streptomyces sp. 796.1 TaxID=3163029 RepID=UPI0039C8C7D7
MRTQRMRGVLVGATALAALGAGVGVAPGAGAADGTRGGARDTGHSAAQAALDAQVAEYGAPGALAQARDKHGVWNGRAGVADLTTQRPRGKDDHFRAGSINKTFVATVLLQLRAEGKVDLDATVDTYLPGVVRGNGHDGRRITVRQLLNHTSGIYNYTADQEFRADHLEIGFLEHRYDTLTPQQLLAFALRHEPDFAPGTDWNYSNTNYVLAGLIIEKVTGSPYATEVQRRILGPLKLRDTSFPGTGSRLPRPHGRAYSKLSTDPKAPIHDVTRLNPSVAWASGEVVTTTADLNRFYVALLRGHLLPAAELAQMKTTVPVADGVPLRYGLGLMEWRLSCGTTVWGHDGGIHGSASYAFADEGADHSIALNLNGDYAGDGSMVVDAEFCGVTDGGAAKGLGKGGEDRAGSVRLGSELNELGAPKAPATPRS